MDLLIARGLSSPGSGGGRAPLFAGVDLRLKPGSSVGLVGPSGSGTSALLRLLAGEESPGAGSVTLAPGVRLSYLAHGAQAPAVGTVWQAASRWFVEVEELAALVAEAAGALERSEPDERGAAAAAYDAHLAAYRARGGPGAAATARRVLAGLGFGPTRHAEDVATLTGDDRRRLALAAALASGADVLLLDEPTDRLDLPTRRWLEGHLSAYRGAVVVVSSDRAFLDGATSTTAFMADGKLSVVRAPYSKAAAAHQQHARSARRRRERAAESERLETLAGELAAYGARRRARRTDRQGAAGDARVTTPTPRHGTLLLRAEHLSLAGLFDDVEVRIAPGDRLALLGPAGSGASELLSLLAGRQRGDDLEQRLWYAPGMHLVSVDRSTRGLAPGVPVVEHGTALLGRDAARRTLASTGLPYGQWTEPPERLSARDRTRVGLAIALARPADLLLLDDPTADLDLSDVEAFEADLHRRVARSASGGGTGAPSGTASGSATGAALVIATHDRRLARTLADRAWSIVDGALVAFSSVPAYLRGDASVSPRTFWEESVEPDEGSGAATAADSAAEARTREALELERSDLLEALSDPLALGDRETERARQRVADIESTLMAEYDASFPPAAPRYRLVEGGLTLYADVVDGREPTGTRLVVVACDDEQVAASAIASDEPTVPWLDARVGDDTTHLRVGPLPGSCLLPATVAALVAAGIYLSFTVLGSRTVQLFSRDPLPTTLLTSEGGGWWRATLESFLEAEGWSGAREGARRRQDGSRSDGGHRRRRRRTRKAVGT